MRCPIFGPEKSQHAIINSFKYFSELKIGIPLSLFRGSFFNFIFSWDRVDPFSSLRTALSDPTNMLLCLCVFLSYLPEAGQYSCFFIYLTQVIGFSVEKVASFIAVIGK